MHRGTDQNSRHETSNDQIDETIGVFRISSSKIDGISRREFLKLSLLTSAAMLVACNKGNPTPTAVPPTPTSILPTPTDIPPTPTSIPPTPMVSRDTFPTYETSVPLRYPNGIGMRRNSNLQSEKITTLPAGLPLTIIGRSGDSRWLEVQLSNGVTGWVSATYFATYTTRMINDLFVSNRTAAVPAALLTSDGSPNEFIENVAQETIETLVEETIEAAADIIKDALPKPPAQNTSPGADTLTLPCVPGAIPPGYICVCNCV